MWGPAAAVTALLASASCACAGADPAARGPVPTTANPGTPVQAAAAALAFAAHANPEVAVVDGYATLPSAVRRGERPIDLAGGHADPCARPPGQRFTSAELAAIRAAFRGRTVSFVGDPAAALLEREPGSL